MDIVNIIKFFLTALTIAIGIITIALMVRKTRLSESNAFQLLSKLILFFNLSMMVSLIHQDFLLKIKPVLSTDAALFLSSLFLLLARILQLFMLYNVALFAWALLNKEFVYKRMQVMKIVLVSLALLMASGSLVQLISHSGGLFFAAMEAAAFIVQSGSLLLCIYIIIKIWKLGQKERRRSIIFLASSYSLFLAGVLLLNISWYLFPDTGFAYWPVEVILDLSINSVVLFWVWKYSEALAGIPAEIKIAGFSETEHAYCNAELPAENPDLTKRECEIIELICMGKSNQEIADELYISLKTVKAHIYNVFRKTGVQRRVQLINLHKASKIPAFQKQNSD